MTADEWALGVLTSAQCDPDLVRSLLAAALGAVRIEVDPRTETQKSREIARADFRRALAEL